MAILSACVYAGFVSGVLAFLAGFFLPMWLMPGANQGPLTGFFVAPVAAVWGGVVGILVATLARTAWQALRIGAISGAVIVVVLSFATSQPSLLKEGEGLLLLGCSVVIFGIGTRGYDEIRRGKIEEQAADINDPEENMFEMALQFGMEEIAADRTLVSRTMSRSPTAAFEIWAESDLSGMGRPCVFDVFDAAGIKFSTFSVRGTFLAVTVIGLEKTWVSTGIGSWPGRTTSAKALRVRSWVPPFWGITSQSQVLCPSLVIS